MGTSANMATDVRQVSIENWSVWCEMALCVTPMMMPCPCPSNSRLLQTFLNLIIFTKFIEFFSLWTNF